LFVPPLRIDLGRLSPWGRFLAARRRFRALVAEEIAARRARPDERCDDVLDLLLAARGEDGRPLDDDELQAHVLTLLVLGHESTASALAWGLVEIYRSPAIVARIRAEVAGLPADAGSDQIAGLPYVGAVCDEILRLRPIVPEVRRRLLRQPWEVQGWSLPAGILLSPCIHLLHRHPQLYPEPEQFRPERFLGRRFAGHEFMPFGGGIRRCTGASFARYEMALALATIVAGVDLAVRDEPIEVRRANLAVIPSTGGRVTVTGRA
jgi:cytochrome P450